MHCLQEGYLINNLTKAGIDLAEPRTGLAMLLEVKDRRKNFTSLNRLFGIEAS